MALLMFFCACLLGVCGGFLSVKSGFFQIVMFKSVWKETVGKLINTKSLEGFKAMSIALGSTIGIGNIIGVSAAILIGGAGAVFWLLLTGVIGMITKYAEIYISVKEARSEDRTCGGTMYVIRSYCKGKLKIFGTVFAVSVVAASLFAGNLVQAKSMYEFLRLGFNIDVLPVTLFTLPLLTIILLGKDKLYQNFSAVLVPIMAAFYVLATVLIIMVNIRNLPNAVLSIFKGAFGFKTIVGGFCGSVLSSAVRIGVMKGLFTNEAGMGSSPIAHCSAADTDPHTAGCWGIVEVFIDTIVVCSLTALSILSSNIYLSGKITDPFTLVCEIFNSTFGQFGLKALSLSAYLFAFASIVGWSFYGIKALEFLSKEKFIKYIYIIFFIGFIPLSNCVGGGIMWTLADVFNSCMLIPNTTVLLYFGGDEVKNLRKGKCKNDLQSLSKKMRC